jgi:hypothetical protein
MPALQVRSFEFKPQSNKKKAHHQKGNISLGMVMHTYNPGTWEAEAGGF